MKYSFIIPAYNSELTISKCLDCICSDIKNSLSNSLLAEIIIVENGSNDSTVKTINDYINKSKYNIILLQSDKGVSRARNKGIQYASGEFVIFVDSDDYWLNGSLKQIEKDTEKNASDLYVYSFIRGYSEKYNSSITHEVKQDMNIKQKKAWMISRPTLRMQCWAKVFKRKILKKNSICFNENIRYSEDSEFVIRYLNHCKKIYISSHPIYNYILSPNSVMRSYDRTRVEQYIMSLKSSIKFLKKSDNLIKNALGQYVLIHLNIILVHDVFIYRKNKSLRKDMILMKKLLKNEIFDYALSKVTLKDCLSFSLLPELFIKLHMNYIVAFMCYLKSYKNQTCK